MAYKYNRPTWCEAGSERDIEIHFLLTRLYDLAIKKGGLSLLDVGFAGSGYIEKILELGIVEYTGIDGDRKRIRGSDLHIPEKSESGYSKEKWRKTLSGIKYINADIINYTSSLLYNVVMSISVIEHIVPMGYSCNNVFDPYMDIQAISSMKKLVKKGGNLMLTFPCGKECILSPEKDFELILKGTSLESKLIKHRYNLLVYNKDRIDKVIGNWKVVEEQYWAVNDKCFEKCEKKEVFNINYDQSDVKVKSLCLLLLEK